MGGFFHLTNRTGHFTTKYRPAGGGGAGGFHLINRNSIVIPREILPVIPLVVIACWTLPAFADSEDAAWSATLYPFRILGCWSEGTVAGCDYNLYPHTFVYGGETYKIDRVILTTQDQNLYLRLNNTISGAQNAILVVGNTSLPFDASTTKYPRWYNTGLDWSDAVPVSLSLWINQESVTLNQESALVNAPPTGADKTITARINSTYTFTESDFGFSDTDTGDSFRKVQITALPSAGSLKLYGIQVTLNQEIRAGQTGGLVFEPASGASGSPYATFQFKVSDGTAYSSQANTITINVNPAATFDLWLAKTGIKANDVGGKSFAYIKIGSETACIVDRLVHNWDQSGYRYLNGSFIHPGSNSEACISPNTQNIILHDSTDIRFYFIYGEYMYGTTFLDPDHPVNPIKSSKPTFVLRHNGDVVNSINHVVNLRFDYILNKSGQYSWTIEQYPHLNGTFTIRVAPSIDDAIDNRLPTGADKTVAISEDATYTFADSDFGFTDTDSGDVLAKITISSLPSAGSLKLDGTQVTLNQEIRASAIPGLIFEPAPGASGSPYTTFQFKVSDGAAYSSQANTITINVNPVNDAPTGADKTITIQENSTQTFTASDFGFSDTDTGDSLTHVQITTLQSAGSLKLDGTQVTLNQEIRASAIPGLIFEPAPGASGSPYTTFQFKVSDGAAYSSQANTITINVQPVDSTSTDVNLSQNTQPTVEVPETAPVITLKGASQMIILLGSTYVDPGYTATDQEDGDLTGNVTITMRVSYCLPIPSIAGCNDPTGGVPVTGAIYTGRVGTYTLYYDVTDSSGNAAVQQIRKVSVNDETAPVITLEDSSHVIITVNSTYAEPGYIATDNYDGDITDKVIVTGTVDVTQTGSYYLYYDVTDGAGNAAIQQVRTVNVVDETAPVDDSQAELSDVVKRYDADGNGAIDTSEWLRACDDYEDGLLTSMEIYTISKARP